MSWQQIEGHPQQAGFPSQPSALAVLDTGCRGEFVAAIGGACAAPDGQVSWPPRAGCDLDELCFGECDAPTDVWLKRSALANGKKTSHPFSNCSKTSSSSSSATSTEPFRRSVIAFPPRPRRGFSLTPLDASGHRLLLFGGCTGQRGRCCTCLGDLHVLQFGIDSSTQSSTQPSARLASSLSLDNEDESLLDKASFCCEDGSRQAADISLSASAMKLAAAKRRCSSGDESSSDDSSEEDEASDMGRGVRRPSTSNGTASQLRSMVDVVSRLGRSTDVGKQPRKEALWPLGYPSLPNSTNVDSVSDGSLRWRAPLAQNGSSLQNRAGHSAVLRLPINPGEDPSVIVYGGLTDTSQLLGDTYEVRISESEDMSLESNWILLDEGPVTNSGNEPAPWDQQDCPRPRTCHSAVFWHGTTNPCMVLFGGLGVGMEGEPRAFGDTWTLVSQDDKQIVGVSGLWQWKRPMMQGGAPARRWGHGACLVGGAFAGGDTMLICGGVDTSNQILSDCWLLDLREMRWEVVETSVPQLHTLRTLNSFVPGSPALRPQASSPVKGPELGRCSVAWSPADDLAIVWGGDGKLWTWREPDAHKWKREERSRRTIMASKRGDVGVRTFNGLQSVCQVVDMESCESQTPCILEADEIDERPNSTSHNETSPDRTWRVNQGAALDACLPSSLSSKVKAVKSPSKGAVVSMPIKELPDVVAPVRKRRAPHKLSGVSSHCDFKMQNGLDDQWSQFGESRAKAAGKLRSSKSSSKEASAPLVIMESVDEWSTTNHSRQSLNAEQNEKTTLAKRGLASQRFGSSSSRMSVDWPLDPCHIPLAKVRSEACLRNRLSSSAQQHSSAASLLDIASIEPSSALEGPGQSLFPASSLRPLSRSTSTSAVCRGGGCWRSVSELT